MVYSRLADVLVVADTVESTDASFEKSDVFHSLEKLDVLDGTKAASPVGESLYVGARTARITMDDLHPNSKGQITADYRLGYATAFLQSVFPANAQLRVIGGREPSDTEHPAQGQGDPTLKQANHFHTHLRDFWVKDYSDGVRPDQHSANWAPVYPTNRADTWASMVGGYGVSRVHIQPVVPAKRDYFLTVIQPSLDPAGTALQTQRIETADTFGVSFTAAGKLYAATFPKTGDGPAVVTITDPSAPVPVPPAPVVVAPAAPAPVITLTAQQASAISAALSAVRDAINIIIGVLAPK
jgi:hypothetical protein